MLKPQTFGFTVLLGALAALPPLSIDLGLPALPAIARDLAASAGVVGLTLGLFLGGFSAAQLVLGSLSDRIGRRPVLLVACGLYAAAGAACALAPSMEALLVARVAQGFGAAGGPVLAFAIVRDLFDGDAARERLSLVSMVLSVAPILAPTIGSVLLTSVGWRGVYAALALAGALLVAFVFLGYGESHRAAPRASVGDAFRMLIRSPRFVLPALINACAFASMFAYVTASPLVMMARYRLSAAGFAAIFALTAGGLLAGAALSGHLARAAIDGRRALGGGVWLAALATLAALALSLASREPSLFVLTPLVVLVTFALGLISPNATHFAMEVRPDLAGAAAALLGFTQMAMGALASAAVGLLYARWDLTAMTAVMAALSGGAALAWAAFRRSATTARL